MPHFGIMYLSVVLDKTKFEKSDASSSKERHGHLLIVLLIRELKRRILNMHHYY